jgi:RNA polymerase sigma-70 factor, ECF subfamily
MSHAASITKSDPVTGSEKPSLRANFSDEALVAALRRSEVWAGEALVQRYHEPLFRYLNRQAGTAHLAEELLQQTWLSVFDHLEQFKYDEHGGVGFKAWVFRIATNKAHDLWRSRGREKHAYDGLKRVADQEMPDASHRLTGSEDDIKLRWAIDQLPEAQKQVVLLRYYSDMKFVEIAEMLGCPLNTALGRMHKAMLKLKKLLEMPMTDEKK